MNKSLQTIPPSPSERGEITVAQMLEKVIEGGITESSVAALDKLCELKIKMDDRAAEMEFNRAFVALQAEMETIEATKAVPNKGGGIRYKFAPYEDLMKAIRPALDKHGFSVSFDSSIMDGSVIRIVSICHLMHTGGHCRKNSFAVRIGGGPPGANETQADGAAKTYAKRGALCDALNIVTTQDTDGDDERGEGKAITEKEAADLKLRAEECGADLASLLKFAGVTRFQDISENSADEIHKILERKENNQR